MATPSHPASPLLCLDTTGKTLMVGIVVDGEFSARYHEASQSHRYHSAVLIPTIQRLLAEADLHTPDLKALAVNIGPGSFTGIRTGLSAIRTLGQFLDVPVYAFNTFELLCSDEPGQVTTIYLDALQSQAYYARLLTDAKGLRYLTEPCLMPLSEQPEPEPGDRLVLSAKLKDGFPGRAVCVIEDEDVYTPEAMVRLIESGGSQGDRYVRRWQDVKALYLQQPNITLRKQQAGTFK